uniref:Uncharacterized protein n=1 Tax=viral metagenome TaxID=1070528 RepID=A0A6C0JQF1_9ZZZZ
MSSNTSSNTSSAVSSGRESKSNNLKWIIGGLLVTGVIGFLIWCFVAGPCKGKKDDGSIGHWSDTQLKTAVSKLPNASVMPDVAMCMMVAISKTISYNDYMKMVPKDQQAYMYKNKDKLSPCLGKKGAWAPDIVNALTSVIVKTKVSLTCAQCIVKQVEDKYDPVEFITLGTNWVNAIFLAQSYCIGKNDCP